MAPQVFRQKPVFMGLVSMRSCARWSRDLVGLWIAGLAGLRGRGLAEIWWSMGLVGLRSGGQVEIVLACKAWVWWA
jgi:hypothetical protein